MEIRVLHYFLTIAREESISGAAKVLHITQPTLSRQMQELEDEFGKKLFVRGNRKITLTDDGLFLRKRAEEIIELVDKTESEMLADQQIPNGDIYIGAGETENMRLIIQIIERIQKDYPNIKFHFYSGNADDVTDKLDKGLLDFGVLIEPVNKTKYDFIKIPATETWGVLMKKDSPLAHLNHITPEDIKNKPLILSSQSMVKNEIASWFGKSYENLNIIATYNLIYNASLMVEENMGYALTIDKLINTTGKSRLCFKPLYPKLEKGLVIVWKKYQFFSKTVDFFLQELQKTFH
mgnify:CR=1 FL=1